jgi:5-oxoprolinase (ATP-hydrolysing)
LIFHLPDVTVVTSVFTSGNEPLPLKEGILEQVRVVLPESLLNPDFHRSYRECPAIVGGNFAVSQRLTDTLLKAFGAVARSQGNMNNLMMGNDG